MAPIYGIDAILKRASKETVDKRCLHGGFLHTLSRSKADAAFWCPFVINILLLLLSSYFFGKDKAARHQGAEKRKLEWTAMQQTEDDEDEVYKECRTTHTRALWTALVSFSVGVILIIIMVEAGLTLQYCHNEELITFYWSFFSVIQLGSVIANLGIFLSELYLYSGQQHPAWNTALGTPILVLLSLVDLAGKLFKDKVLPSNSSSSEVGRIPLIGYQIEGDDDVRFCFRDRIPEAAVTVIALPDSMSYLRVAPVVQKEMTRESAAP